MIVIMIISDVQINVDRSQAFRGMQWTGNVLLKGMETIGEHIVTFIGIDQSHFQDVLDSMTPEELAHAQRINEERERENKEYEESQQYKGNTSSQLE